MKTNKSRIILNEISAPKRPNLAQNWNFWPNIGILGPFGLMAGQKLMRTKCLGGLPLPNLSLSPVEIKNWHNLANWQILAFWPFRSHARPNNSAKKVRRCFFGPKKAKFGPKYAFLGTSRPCWFISCRVGWWLWCAGCISQDNHLLYDKVSAKTASWFQKPPNFIVVIEW